MDAGGYCHHDHYYHQHAIISVKDIERRCFVHLAFGTPHGAVHKFAELGERQRAFREAVAAPYQMQPEQFRKACTTSEPINWGAEIDDLYQLAIS